GLRYPIQIGLIGDIKATLKELLPMLEPHVDRSFLELAQKRMSNWRMTLATLEDDSSTPMKPTFLVKEVSRILDEDAHISVDTGAHTLFTASHLQIKKDQQITVCGNLASMGPGLPYAIASQLAFPDRQCIAMVGDGSFTMLMGEMAT